MELKLPFSLTKKNPPNFPQNQKKQKNPLNPELENKKYKEQQKEGNPTIHSHLQQVLTNQKADSQYLKSQMTNLLDKVNNSEKSISDELTLTTNDMKTLIKEQGDDLQQ